jgi:hypothetical protein
VLSYITAVVTAHSQPVVILKLRDENRRLGGGVPPG